MSDPPPTFNGTIDGRPTVEELIAIAKQHSHHEASGAVVALGEYVLRLEQELNLMRLELERSPEC